MDVPRDLRTDEREVSQHGTDDPVAQAWVAAQSHPEKRDEDHHQRKQREEPVVRDQRCEVTGPILTEFPDNGEGKRDPGMALLGSVDAAKKPDEGHVRRTSPSRLPDPHSLEKP